MIGMSPGIYFFLLQADDQVKYFKDDNPVQAMILLVGIVAVIIIALLFHFFRHGVSASVAGKSGKTRSTLTPRKFNAFTLYRIASSYGLDRDQTKLLEYVFRNDAVTDPERVMRNPLLLDRHFKRAYRTIEKNSDSEETAQQRLVKLFSLRNVIDAAPAASGPASSQLSENTPAVLMTEKDSYPVKIITSHTQDVITEVPRNALGTPVRLFKGSKITLSFFTKSSKGFAFDGQVMGMVDTTRGPGIQIAHNGKAKPLVKRRFRRRQTSIRCEFYHVYADESGAGKNRVSRLVVDTRKYTGIVLDVSIGGCSLKTSAPIQVGSRLKISIDYDDNYIINVLGQVLRTNRSGAAGTIIHLKFLKVPRRAFNCISALVFGYDDD